MEELLMVRITIDSETGRVVSVSRTKLGSRDPSEELKPHDVPYAYGGGRQWEIHFDHDNFQTVWLQEGTY